MGGDASYTKPIVVSKAGSIGGVDVGSSLNTLQGPGGYQSIDFPRADSPQLKDARGQHKGVQFDGSWGGGSQGVHTHQAVMFVAVARGENQNLWITRLKTKKVAHPQGRGSSRRVDSG